MAKEITCKSCRTVEDYLVDRVQQKMDEYTTKGRRYRFWCQVFATSAALGALAVPTLINVLPEGNNDLVPTIVSLIVAAVVAIEGLFHFREHWRTYDLMRAKLQEEEMRFSVEFGCLTGREMSADGQRKAFLDFVDRIEDAIAKERAETIGMRTAPTDSQGRPLREQQQTGSGNGAGAGVQPAATQVPTTPHAPPG